MTPKIQLLELFIEHSLAGRDVDEVLLRGAMSAHWRASAATAASWEAVRLPVAGIDRAGTRRGVYRIGRAHCWHTIGKAGIRVPHVSLALAPAPDLAWLVGTNAGPWPACRQLAWRLVEVEAPVVALDPGMFTGSPA